MKVLKYNLTQQQVKELAEGLKLLDLEYTPSGNGHNILCRSPNGNGENIILGYADNTRRSTYINKMIDKVLGKQPTLEIYCNPERPNLIKNKVRLLLAKCNDKN